MLHEFLTENRNELVSRCKDKVVQRHAPKTSEPDLESGIPTFLAQLIKTLQVEQSAEPLQSRSISGAAGGKHSVSSEMGAAAARHGRELLLHGFSVDQVVHDYGDLCQAITDLAFEMNAPIQVDEFRTLNRCLDNAIADAVTEFAYHRESQSAEREVLALNERLGFLAHELRNLINTASLAVTAIKAGNVGLTGATGAVLDRSLIALRNLIDRSLAEVRVTAGLPARYELVSVADFISDVKISATLEAQAHDCRFTVSDVSPELAVDADRDMLFSAVGNLLQNAFKYTQHQTDVSLNAHASADRVLIDVKDHCGGLPENSEGLFTPFAQAGPDRSGLGLGLSICRRSVEANNGVVSFRNVPGSGCVFTIDLPRHALPEPAPA